MSGRCSQHRALGRWFFLLCICRGIGYFQFLIVRLRLSFCTKEKPGVPPYGECREGAEASRGPGVFGAGAGCGWVGDGMEQPGKAGTRCCSAQTLPAATKPVSALLSPLFCIGNQKYFSWLSFHYSSNCIAINMNSDFILIYIQRLDKCANC